MNNNATSFILGIVAGYLVFTETGFTITAKSSALGGDNVTIKFRVSKNINGMCGASAAV